MNNYEDAINNPPSGDSSVSVQDYADGQAKAFLEGQRYTPRSVEFASTPAAPGIDLEQFREAVVMAQAFDKRMDGNKPDYPALLALIDASSKGDIDPLCAAKRPGCDYPACGCTDASPKGHPTRSYPLDALGNPMREHQPGAWESAQWPSDAIPKGGERVSIPDDLAVSIRGFLSASFLPSAAESTPEMRQTYSYWQRRLLRAGGGAMDYDEATGAAKAAADSSKGGSNVVTDAMVEAAHAAYWAHPDDSGEDRPCIRAALEAAMQATSAEVGA